MLAEGWAMFVRPQTTFGVLQVNRDVAKSNTIQVASSNVRERETQNTALNLSLTLFSKLRYPIINIMLP